MPLVGGFPMPAHPPGDGNANDRLDLCFDKEVKDRPPDAGMINDEHALAAKRVSLQRGAHGLHNGRVAGAKRILFEMARVIGPCVALTMGFENDGGRWILALPEVEPAIKHLPLSKQRWQVDQQAGVRVRLLTKQRHNIIMKRCVNGGIAEDLPHRLDKLAAVFLRIPAW